ncbi:hypothetical protein [Haladaptatus sp. ZSTT2]|uniref:hypothetical protein n=1 Tax=Haladaptatus sp. ZSTT2 TaxID=3120515 RepID=UPI00300F7370
MIDDELGDTTTLNDLEFPAPHDQCVAAVLATREYIHTHDGATKAEILQAFEPEQNHPLGHNGLSARLTGLVPEFRDWWWQKTVTQGLNVLPDIEAPHDENGVWRPITEDES